MRSHLRPVMVAVITFVSIMGIRSVVGRTQNGKPPEDAGPPLKMPEAAKSDADWVPGTSEGVVPTAFPNLKPPAWNADGGHRVKLAELCPFFVGGRELKIEPGDTTLQKLLKARINQGRLELECYQNLFTVGKWVRSEDDNQWLCLDDMRDAITELFQNDPKALAAWLTELLILTKERERWMIARVAAGQETPQKKQEMARLRLKMEAELWKAQNPARK
jgi:hypothetical protein